ADQACGAMPGSAEACRAHAAHEADRNAPEGHHGPARPALQSRTASNMRRGGAQSGSTLRNGVMTDAPWPTQLRLHKDRRTLCVTCDNGAHFDLAAEYLRVRSPSAEVQGHSPDERKTIAGKRDVGILEVNPVGNYAVRLVFDDLHFTGIFTWTYLFELGTNRE